ncbi:hypothetical protein BpHYR1_044867 [Brachionus plicatilis]|uniref:Uncharacterized protein n=1 Tax=Brachionus plicatilis TaxID=10195 RepID=A0A3M7R0X2_BRAPC|nr:hypothetical protein BpHYR1_044867 [Brachionus plicatilis]
MCPNLYFYKIFFYLSKNSLKSTLIKLKKLLNGVSAEECLDQKSSGSQLKSFAAFYIDLSNFKVIN